MSMISAMQWCNAIPAAAESIQRTSVQRMYLKSNVSVVTSMDIYPKNCPEKSRGSDGKGTGKRSKGVNKGDNWNKGKGKKGKGKGKSKGKSKGKKGLW